MDSSISALLTLRTAFFGVALVALVSALLVGLNHLLAHPSKTEAAEIVYGDLLRYEILHGEPHVVFHHNDRVYFDELKRDYKLLVPSGWILSGMWYYIPETDEPASVGVARCTGIAGEACGKETELFGQINSPEITTLEVEYDGEWLRFPAEAPGYAVRLDDRYEAPTGYRWLDSNDDIVHEQGYVEPLHPGRDQ